MPRGEVATEAVVHDVLRQGKQLFVPYIYNGKSQDHTKSRSAMDMVSLSSKSDYEALTPDAWGIPTVAEKTLAERIRILEGFSDSLDANPQDIVGSQWSSRNRSKESRTLDLIVMPGVAFDGDLGRLGHGKGFYDGFLKRYHDLKISLLEEEVKMPFLGACLRLLDFGAGPAEPDSY